MSEPIEIEGYQVVPRRSDTWVMSLSELEVLHIRQVGSQWFGHLPRGLEDFCRGATLEECARAGYERFQRARAERRERIAQRIKEAGA